MLMLNVNLTFYEMFDTSINSLNPRVKADISVNILCIAKHTYQTNMVKRRQILIS